MIPAAAVQAYRDARLKRRDLRVYAYALESLSFLQPRPFKICAVSRATALAPSHAAASVRRLRSAGYLERGPNNGAIRTYILTTTTRLG